MNFERRLLEVIREARWFSRMGVEVPEAAKMLLPQDEKFRDYQDRLTHLLLVSRMSSDSLPTSSAY